LNANSALPADIGTQVSRWQLVGHPWHRHSTSDRRQRVGPSTPMAAMTALQTRKTRSKALATVIL